MELILETLLTALRENNVPAVEQFPETPLDRTNPVVCVSVSSAAGQIPAFARYLGEWDGGDGPVEVYGWKQDVTIALELYAPDAARSGELLTDVGRALEHLPGGLRPRRVERGALAPDRATGMFRCPVTMDCTAFLVRLDGDDAVQWSDFIVKGEIR